ncbi:transposase [Paenibacillus larvae subsp. larvae]|uniref:Transposase n=1 Tax=Paenibacillus larvae subsp. larvae TaxID=147375 RepID=A0A2L1U0G2_9BACL|nr:hypothetical protein B5S25_19285 [Paenibacillus larvae subsp. pulvifaciens]AVF26413.1 transposase [Paenibacillus larvae subsp. larvae]AVF31190.1 transposase [Paenibacillus larvae subsp. larvae]
MRFQYLKENKDKYNIKKACKTLNISRSGYYEYLQRKPSKRALENEVLCTEIHQLFNENKGRYGSLRITKALEKKGIKVNRKRVGKLIRQMKLYAKGSRYCYKRYNKKSSSIERPNLLNQVFHTNHRNKIWVGDMTYIPTQKGTLYLNGIYRYVHQKSSWLVHEYTYERFPCNRCFFTRISERTSKSRANYPYRPRISIYK